ncbi:MAG: B12-binding domain-containing radical SAM protein [Gammaproteobacteria bacterium]|nr:B12-binding domain-containing radical SAM protein [Gammaproteobacteria bacterium]MDH5799734.1 B12-binding domain-containing radical SAM protein [Gammaproteobacteria bacterium]
MKKITFINPPYERIAPGYDFINHITNRSPSLGLLHLAAQVREDGYLPAIIEGDIENLNAEQVAKRIIQSRPEYVGITLFTVAVWCAAEIAKRIKQELPDTIILVGGPHISSMGMETMQRFPDFDIAVTNEGELVLSELLPILDAGKTPHSVKGIIYRMGDQLMQTPAAPTTSNLDELPVPAWDLLPNFPKAYLPAIYDYPKGPVATIAASRGCPFLCKFCDTSTFGAKVRAYSPEMVFNMMQHLHNTYGIRHIMFVDDLFLASKIRTLALCDMILESGLEMTWSCTARVDTVKPEVLKRMKQAGCWEISFGLETGSNELLQKMEKAARVEKSEQAINWTHEAGIRCKGLFMLGYPGETQETIEMTKAFCRRIPMTTMNLTKFTPYPGSPIYRELYGTNIKEDHWERMNGMNFVWAPEGITVEQLDREYQNLLKAFYRRPEVAHKYLFVSLRYPHHLYRLLKFALGFAKAKLISFLSGRKGLLVKEENYYLDANKGKTAN